MFYDPIFAPPKKAQTKQTKLVEIIKTLRICFFNINHIKIKRSIRYY